MLFEITCFNGPKHLDDWLKDVPNLIKVPTVSRSEAFHAHWAKDKEAVDDWIKQGHEKVMDEDLFISVGRFNRYYVELNSFDELFALQKQIGVPLLIAEDNGEYLRHTYDPPSRRDGVAPCTLEVHDAECE